MTEHKKRSERMSLQDYWAVTEEEISPQNFSSHKKYEPSRRGNQVRKDAGIPHTIQRVVTNPDADPATAWGTFAQRKRAQSQERAKSEQRVKSVPRTLAQTGAPATHGRAKMPNRPLPDNKSIPRRSSQRIQIHHGIKNAGILKRLRLPRVDLRPFGNPLEPNLSRFFPIVNDQHLDVSFTNPIGNFLEHLFLCRGF